MPTPTANHRRIFACLPIFLGPLIAATIAQAQPNVRLPLDTGTTIRGAGLACTGIGQTKALPRWRAYPVRIEFADARRDYLAGETVTLSPEKGGPILSVTCNGPWLLLKPPDGETYKVEAMLSQPGAQPRSTLVESPPTGQKQYVLTFPEGY